MHYTIYMLLHSSLYIIRYKLYIYIYRFLRVLLYTYMLKGVSDLACNSGFEGRQVNLEACPYKTHIATTACVNGDMPAMTQTGDRLCDWSTRAEKCLFGKAGGKATRATRGDSPCVRMRPLAPHCSGRKAADPALSQWLALLGRLKDYEAARASGAQQLFDRRHRRLVVLVKRAESAEAAGEWADFAS